MIRIKPVSIKFPEEIRSQVERVAKLLGYSTNKVVVEAVESTLRMLDSRRKESLPKILVLARAALAYESANPQLSKTEIVGSKQRRILRRRL